MPFPVAFHGASYFIQNVLEFGRPELVKFDAEAPELFGVHVESFLVGSWRDEYGRISAERWLSQVPEHVAALTRRGRCVLLLDMSGEGPAFMEDRIAALHAALDKRAINPKACVLLQQNRRLPADYQAWARDADATPMTTLCYDYYPRRMAGLLARSHHGYKPNAKMREKAFLCPNFTPERHRASLVSWLLAEALSERGFISFRIENKNDPSNALYLSDYFPDPETIARGLAILKRRAPLLLDLPTITSENPDFGMLPDHFYDQSYFSIVTDTNITHDVNRFTEKLIKPMAMYHPILLLGFPHTFPLLESLGFKTFGDIFDQTYDSIEDTHIRVAAFMQELRRVMRQDQRSLHEAYHRMEDVLAHNADIATRLLDEHYRSSWDAQLLSQIMGL